MKLTNKQLKQIIKEELGRVLYENPEQEGRIGVEFFIQTRLFTGLFWDVFFTDFGFC